MTEIWTPRTCDLTMGDTRWTLTHTKPDGAIVAHEMPASTPIWRAAEYHIDDIEEIWHMILHEPFVTAEPINIHSMTAQQAHAKHKKRLETATVSLDHLHGVFKSFYAGHHVTPERVARAKQHIQGLRDQHEKMRERRANARQDAQDLDHLRMGPPVMPVPPQSRRGNA
jgi:hypothetical protein